MRRETQNILLILLGGALLKISFSGLYLRYVQKGFLPLLVIAGVVMVGLAGFSIYRDVCGARVPSHSHSSRSVWLMLLPVLAVFLISPPALGVDVVNTSSDTNRTTSRGGFSALPSDQVVPLSLTEFVTRTAWDDSGTLDGRTVRLTGFLVRQGDHTYVARLAISCCAADARPLKVHLTGLQAGFGDGQWVEVTGKAVPKSATKENSYIPTFTVENAVPVAVPAEQYES
ncbi:TIGR03943 family protein [Lentzea sp. NBRC 105346]|uniref:TIGR03943 family putative permease subunit n=1 Tax=Lentzea sp. NBRC 105346 TaxID=3032205 RepID=UPI0025572538|nr:TIGR03943 family protein [Lentzea sp. NBRC 105346]GLZ33972.1 TIGR03943 family protein [Lentzea sp. NBRC 105346]